MKNRELSGVIITLILLVVAVLLAALVTYFAVGSMPTNEAEDIIYNFTSTQVIHVPKSFGDPVAVTSSYNDFRFSMITIVFERGTIMTRINPDTPYEFVYVEKN